MVAMRARFILIPLLVVGCGDDPPAMPDAVPPDSIDDFIGEHPQLALPCADSQADVYTLPAGLPAMDDSRRGDVFRCAKTEKLTFNQVKTQISAYNEGWDKATPGVVKSGVWTYRIAYRTTRNTVNDVRAEGASPAVVLIPERPLAGAPVVIAGHGSVGFASKCAPSLLDLSTGVGDHDYPPVFYRLAGYGYTVIAPDYAGFAYGQPPGYFNAEDEAHAILDATRAAAKILSTPPSKVAFVGYSQGAHAVIAAHAYAKSYGMEGELVAVAALAPPWMSMSIWGAAPTTAAGLNTTEHVGSILYAMAYAYSAGELREEGTGGAVFQADKRAAAVEVLTGAECYDQGKMMALGATPADFFDPDYVNEVGLCAIQGSCGTTLAQMWRDRWIEDRPAIDAMGPPILAVFAAADTFVTAGRASCVKKKLDADLAMVSGATTKVEYCMTPNYEHRDLIRSPAADYVNEWIAAKAGVGQAPAACTPFTGSFCAQIPYDH
jgi:pimeloyl-ACP methyl ester carboxylesterase